MASAWLLKTRLRVRRALAAPRRRLRPFEGADADMWRDLLDTWRQRDLVISLAHQRTIARYRSTILGPAWIILSFVIATFGLSLLWAEIMGRPFHLYFPYIALGFLIWNFFTGILSEGARALMDNKSLALQTRTPMTMFPTLVVIKHAVIAAHNAPYVIGVMLFYAPRADASLLLVIPGIVLVALFALGLVIALCVWCAYLPDLAEVIASAMRFAFFLTPVIWMTFQRTQLEEIYMLNPLFHMLNVVRGVVLQHEHVALSFIWMGAATMLAWMIAAYTYWRAAGAVSSRL